ncbi:hypothetical protein V8E54_009378 [Elaphomyces granulatus]
MDGITTIMAVILTNIVCGAQTITLLVVRIFYYVGDLLLLKYDNRKKVYIHTSRAITLMPVRAFQPLAITGSTFSGIDFRSSALTVDHHHSDQINLQFNKYLMIAPYLE